MDCDGIGGVYLPSFLIKNLKNKQNNNGLGVVHEEQNITPSMNQHPPLGLGTVKTDYRRNNK